MERYKQEFIEFLIQTEVLSFGEFIAKSRRKMPYLIDMEKVQTEEQMRKLGAFYVQGIRSCFPGQNFNVFFSAAFTDLPLIVAISRQLARSYCIICKEAKACGEGELQLGHKLIAGDRILFIGDTLPFGKSATTESINLLRKEFPSVLIEGGIVLIDVMEKNWNDSKSAIREIKDQLGIDFQAIVTMDDIVDFLRDRDIDGRIVLNASKILKDIRDYRDFYGAK